MADDSVKAFDNYEDMLAYMREQETAANMHVRERQKTGLGWGTYGLRVVHDLPIWTHIWSQEQAFEGEDEYTIPSLLDSHDRGYRYGMHYSALCIEGEIGSAHISTMWPIPERDFNVARDIGWVPTRTTHQWFAGLLERIRREMADDAAGIQHSKFDADPGEGQTFFVDTEEDTT